MAKREIRAVQADQALATMIDHAADVDTQLKNLGYEDKGIKTKIVENAKDQMSNGELSVRLMGTKASAVVSGVAKIVIDPSAESFGKVREATINGLLEGEVKRSVQLAIPEHDIERAAAELQKLGINAVVTETFSIESSLVVTDPNKSFVGSVQKGEAIEALAKCITTDVTYRVKYERI